MKTTILILALAYTFFSCSSKKITLDNASNNSPIQASLPTKTARVSFSSQIESEAIGQNFLPNAPATEPVNAVVNTEITAAQAIAVYIPVYQLTTPSVEVNEICATIKLSFGNRLKLKAVKAVFGKNAPEGKTSSDVNTIGGILNKLSFWFGLFSIVAAIFVPGLGFTFGILGLIFGIIGTTISSSSRESGRLGILLSAIGILVSIIFAAIYDQLFFNRRR